MLGKDIIKVAQKYKGASGTKFWKDYGLPKGSHWCCAFVWDIFRIAGVSGLFFDGKKTAYVPTAQAWLKAYCKKVSMTAARPGDIVVFTWQGTGYNRELGSRDHIGFIEKRGNENHCYTLEGNTGASSPSQTRVMSRIRDAKYIYGIYRPSYHTNAWYLRVKAKKITAYMDKHNFKYVASWTKNAVTWAGAKKRKTTNCSTMVCYALQQAGFIRPGEYFWINGNKIVCKNGLTKKELKKIAVIKHPHKSPKKAKLKKGDICGYKNPAHTQIFAGWTKSGRPKWYSTGSNKDIQKGVAHVKKSYDSKKIDTIIRLK